MNDSASIVAETAPSDIRPGEPTFARVLGACGLSMAVLGIIAVVANQYGPRLVGTSSGYFFAALGTVLMLFHALRDGDFEFRRAYTLIGAAFLLAALAAGVAPGPMFAEATAKTTGYHLLPWSPVFALMGLAFLAAPLRHETNPGHRNTVLLALLLTGLLLAVGGLCYGIAQPVSLIGPALLFILVGLLYLGLFLGFVGTDEGLGRLVAAAIGVIGTLVIAYALGRAIGPPLLAEGPSALKNAYQRIDIWKAAARATAIVLFAGLAIWGLRAQNMPKLSRGLLVLFGGGFAALFVYATFQTYTIGPQAPFFIPTGLILLVLGLAFLGLSIGMQSDRPLIVLLRRELVAYFYSPIAWFVLIGMAVITWLGYFLFVGVITYPGRGEIQEPILSDYYAGSFIGPLAVLVLIPAITMRLFAEEKRSGTLEVLMTAPVSEIAVLASKMIAAWLFYMVCWIPMGLYLIALRVEGGQPFDYRPLLSLYIAIGVSGFAFIAMGAFFSSITNNQIVAAVLTFVGLILLFALRWHEYFPLPADALRNTMSALSALSYWLFWENALRGQLQIRDLSIQFSLGVFWTFLTLKSLNVRKWG